MRASLMLLAAQAALGTASGCQSPPNEVPMIREYFATGGEYVDDGTGKVHMEGQVYVEHLTPPDGPTKQHPIILIHGKAQTGSNWINKPDGGRGWASTFIEQGYELYIIDQAARGRSTWLPEVGTSMIGAFEASYVEQHFTAAEQFNLWPQASKHTQWPGTGLRGDTIFDQLYASQVQYSDNTTWQQTHNQRAGAALLDRIGRPAVILGHSQGGLMPPVIADARPELTKAMVLLEPSGPAFQNRVFSNKTARAWGISDIPVTYDPPVTDPETDLIKATHPPRDNVSSECILQAESPAPRRLANLADLPILMVTTESSYHAVYDWCTAEYYKQAGCSKLKHVELADAGISGNGHMLFLEKNSDEIQALVRDWIEDLE